MTTAVQKKAKPGLWAGLFAVNLAVIVVLWFTGALEPPVPYILFALNFILLFPFIRASREWQEEQGAMTPALRRYNRRFLGASAVYSVMMLGGAGIANSLPEGSPLLWAIAVATMLPAFAMIWVMIRYLAEETDEYLRHRAVNGAMVGLGFVLVLGTGWGFLETFGLVPHVWAWWVFPAWAIGLGIGMGLPERGGEIS